MTKRKKKSNGNKISTLRNQEYKTELLIALIRFATALVKLLNLGLIDQNFRDLLSTFISIFF